VRRTGFYQSFLHSARLPVRESKLVSPHDVVKELRDAKAGEDAALLTGEGYARLVDARGRAQAEKETLEAELTAEVKAARLDAKTSKEKDAAAERLRPLEEARRARIESKMEEIMLPVEALRRRKETRERVEEDLRDAEKLYREGLAQA
jgi:hypothetical protein